MVKFTYKTFYYTRIRLYYVLSRILQEKKIHVYILQEKKNDFEYIKVI